ncbi:SirB2 family protein [Neiella marina]|uniref:SirB2 family protein n=1 Tax=Neiella holothuriorum TaxID=2870530 RepID=A0ABS7EHM3_9GAMM|nr:SirB2 family protein [Neiella holothuriorum]MBW8191837.1 SirB2 family protein [Neiella holothuriorum]
MYTGLKHLHVLLVALSVGLLILRAIWLMRGSALMQRKWVKIVPHVIDTALLAAAIGMVSMMPGLNQPWLWEKLVLVVLYIGFGFYLFKFAKSTGAQIAGLIGALACVATIAHLARSKMPFILG